MFSGPSGRPSAAKSVKAFRAYPIASSTLSNSTALCRSADPVNDPEKQARPNPLE